MFCFRLSFFPRWRRAGQPGRAGFGPGNRTGQPGRTDGFGPGNRAGRVASGRAGFGSGNRAGRVASGRAGQPSLQLTVTTGEPTCGSTGTPTGGSIVPYSRSKVRSSNRWFNRPYNRSKVRPFNRSFNSPPTDAKSGPSTGPSTDAPDSHANAPQPKSQTMQRDSGRTVSAILKNLCEVTHFYT